MLGAYEGCFNAFLNQNFNFVSHDVKRRQRHISENDRLLSSTTKYLNFPVLHWESRLTGDHWDHSLSLFHLEHSKHEQKQLSDHKQRSKFEWTKLITLSKMADKSHSAESNTNSLWSACDRGDTDAVIRLLNNGHRDVNARNCLGCTPLLYACGSGHLETVSHTSSHRVAIKKDERTFNFTSFPSPALIFASNLMFVPRRFAISFHDLISMWIVAIMIVWQVSCSPCKVVHSSASPPNPPGQDGKIKAQMLTRKWSDSLICPPRMTWNGLDTTGFYCYPFDMLSCILVHVNGWAWTQY